MMLQTRVVVGGGSGTEDGEKWPHLRFASASRDLRDADADAVDEDEPVEDEAVEDEAVEDEAVEDGVEMRLQSRNGDGDAFKRRPSKKRVSFPDDDMKLASCFIEPALDADAGGPPASCRGLVAVYAASCRRNGVAPVDRIVEQLETLDLRGARSASLTLRGLELDSRQIEALEDVLKTVPLKLLDLGASHASDDGLIALFDMIEFYEAASHVSIAANKTLSSRGWQACCRMIKRTECLEWLDAAQVSLSEHGSILLARALRANARLRVLHLNGCNLSGRPLTTLACALKMNSNLCELHLAENRFAPRDALQLAILLTSSKSLQLIDLRNNRIEDQGFVYLCDALVDNTTLHSLTVWNNGITRQSSPALAKLLAVNESLETLNLGHNALGDDGLVLLIRDGLEKNRHLLNLGLQDSELSCAGLIALAECLANGTRLQRVDLRKNVVQVAGLMALAAALKISKTVTCLDLNCTVSPSCQHPEEFSRLSREIGELCEAHRVAAEEAAALAAAAEAAPAVETAAAAAVQTPPTSQSPAGARDRKISLTCALPIRENRETSSARPSSAGSSSAEASAQVDPNHLSPVELRQPRPKLRSPLPSPGPSPSPSPIPSPCSGRFKVTRVEGLASSLPTPRSRFTVTPVQSHAATGDATVEAAPPTPPSHPTRPAHPTAVPTQPTPVAPVAAAAAAAAAASSAPPSSHAPSDVADAKATSDVTPAEANLVRSSPSKVVVGFDVIST